MALTKNKSVSTHIVAPPVTVCFSCYTLFRQIHRLCHIMLAEASVLRLASTALSSTISPRDSHVETRKNSDFYGLCVYACMLVWDGRHIRCTERMARCRHRSLSIESEEPCRQSSSFQQKVMATKGRHREPLHMVLHGMHLKPLRSRGSLANYERRHGRGA